MKPTAALLLATIALSAATAVPRPAVRPALKLRGGALPRWPALYKAVETDKTGGEKASRNKLILPEGGDLTAAGEVMKLVIAVAGIFTLRAISFENIIARLPGPGQFAVLLVCAFMDVLWPKRTLGRLVANALSSSTMLYAMMGVTRSVMLLAVVVIRRLAVA